MASKTVRVDVDRWIATVALDRAASGNLIDERMAFELADVCERLRRDSGIRVVVLTGKGDAFCRGTQPPPQTGRDERLHVDALPSLRVAGCVAAIEKPVIAALNGDALDQGLELALAADIRIAAAEARLGLTQVERGLMPWDGGTQRLPRLVGRGRGMEMLLTSRVVDAQEAMAMGLVNRVVGPGLAVREAGRLAAMIAAQGPVAAGYLKEAVQKGLDLALEQGLRLEADLGFILQSTADRDEGIRSFLERRTPDYRGE